VLPFVNLRDPKINGNEEILPLLFVAVFAGCKKDADELLTRSWKITAITSKTNGVSTQENVSMCSANRIWTFSEDKSF
jgi:hypothetical protein